MFDTVYFVKSILPRADIGSFQHFVNIYFSKSVCISVCWGYQVSGTYGQVSFIAVAHVVSLLCSLKFPLTYNEKSESISLQVF